MRRGLSTQLSEDESNSKARDPVNKRNGRQVIMPSNESKTGFRISGVSLHLGHERLEEGRNVHIKDAW